MNLISKEHRKYVRNRDHTYRQQLADFKLEGKWHLINYFSFVITAFVNNQPTGHISGKVLGENYGYCIICGTPIIHHYTVEDEITKRKYNIGCECIVKVLEESKARSITRAIQSLRNKTVSDYKRPIKQRQLSLWLNSIYKKSDEIRLPLFLDEIRKYQKREYPNKSKEDIEKKLDDILWDGKHYWEFHAKTFPQRDWNPDNMRKQYKEVAEKYETEHPPHWRKLGTDDEIKLNKILETKINEYINKLGV